MKKIAIVAPYFPPSNLTCVHRSRFLVSHLKQFGWEPIVLSVRPEYYTWELSNDLEKLLPEDLCIIRTKALPFYAGPIRLIRDASARSFLWHWSELRRMAKEKEIDFLYISLQPAFATLLGRLIHEEFHVPYGIDFQDPWAKWNTTGKPFFSKAWIAEMLARVLEPVAVKKASLITSVADSYIEGVISRNKHLEKAKKLIIPIGFDPQDHEKLDTFNKRAYIFNKSEHCFNFIYAGAMLPKAYEVLRTLFKSLEELKKRDNDVFQKIKIYFVGTGKSPTDKEGYNIRPIAEEFGLYGKTVIEYPARIPYLDVLAHLKEADGIILLGSTEKHYTPSKVFQAVFSESPILAVLQEESTAVKFLNESNSAEPITFADSEDLKNIIPKISEKITGITREQFDKARVNYHYFDRFTAEAIAKELAGTLDYILGG